MEFANRFDGYRICFRKMFRSKRLKEKDGLILKEAIDFVRENYVKIKPKDGVIKYSAVAVGDEDDKLIDAKKYFKELAEIENAIKETFSQAVQSIAKEKGVRLVDIYKRVNVDRRIFSKLKKDKKYQPSKSTAILMAIGLRLNVVETNELLMKAGFTLSHSRVEDLIVEFFIQREIYDLYLINLALYEKTGHVLKSWLGMNS